VTYRFEAELWKVPGDSAWHFLTLPFELADEIDELTTESQRGFGSVRVHVTIGGSEWDTSLFPDRKAESYVLPVKKPVRSAESIAAGDRVEVRLELIDLVPGPSSPPSHHSSESTSESASE
jgi:hypothetical protein